MRGAPSARVPAPPPAVLGAHYRGEAWQLQRALDRDEHARPIASAHIPVYLWLADLLEACPDSADRIVVVRQLIRCRYGEMPRPTFAGQVVLVALRHLQEILLERHGVRVEDPV